MTVILKSSNISSESGHILNSIGDTYFETLSTHFIKLDSFSMYFSNSADSTEGMASPDVDGAATAAGAATKIDIMFM